MYDTINSKQYKSSIGYDNIEDIVFNECTDVRQTNYENGYTITGNYHNLIISSSDTTLKIKGSVSKYALGDNQKSLSRGDMQRAIEKLSDELHFNISNNQVTRLDISQNMIMKYDPMVYLNQLGGLQFFERLQQPNGLYYNHSCKQHLFYGKIKEQLLKGYDVPEFLQDMNMLRYETRITSRLPKFFNQSEVQIKDLYYEPTYVFLGDYWKNEYFRINKINSLMTGIELDGSTKQMLEMAFLMLNEITGTNSFYDLIKQGQQTKTITKKQALDLRAKVKQITTSRKLTSKSELIEELDRKVIESIEYYR